MDESPQAELFRLTREQIQSRLDEVFGGLSPSERNEYDGKTKRINELEILQNSRGR